MQPGGAYAPSAGHPPNVTAAVTAAMLATIGAPAAAAAQPGPKVNAQLERLAQQQNERLPVDNGMMRVNRVSGGGGRYEYHITVIADRAGLSKAEWIERWKRRVEGMSLAEQVRVRACVLTAWLRVGCDAPGLHRLGERLQAAILR